MKKLCIILKHVIWRFQYVVFLQDLIFRENGYLIVNFKYFAKTIYIRNLQIMCFKMMYTPLQNKRMWYGRPPPPPPPVTFEAVGQILKKLMIRVSGHHIPDTRIIIFLKNLTDCFKNYWCEGGGGGGGG